MWFKKWISDLKFHQNYEKLRFSIVFIDFYITNNPKRSKNDLKRSKMIKNSSKWSEMVKLCDNVVQEMDFWCLFHQNHEKLRFSMVFIDFILLMIQNDPKTI